MHRIEAVPGGGEGEKRRVLQPAEMLDVPESTRTRVDPIDVDAVAAAVAFRRGVAADIGVERTCYHHRSFGTEATGGQR